MTGAFMQPFSSGSSSPLLEDFRDHHPEFWDACITFLTTLRTEEDLPALRDLLLENARTCPLRSLHDPAMVQLEDPLHALVDGLYEGLVYCLTVGQHPLIRLDRPYLRKGLGKRHGRWPETADQLFPFDEQQCVDMHVFWLGQRFSAAPLGLLNAILLVARPKVLPHLCAGRTHNRLLYVLTQMLHANVVDVPEGWEGDIPLCPAGDAALPLAQQDQDRREGMRAVAEGLLNMLAHGLDDTPDDHGALFAGQERAAFHAIFAALRDDKTLLEHLGPQHALVRYAEYLLRRLGIPLSFCAGVLERRAPPRAPPSAGANFAKVVKHHLELLERQRGCCGPGCARTIHDNGGRTYPVCARCKVVQYCGRDCQQRDWATGQYRHKAICPLLCRLLAEASVTMSLSDFTQAFERALPGREGERDLLDYNYKSERVLLFEWASCAGLLYDDEQSQIFKEMFESMNEVLDDLNEEGNDVIRELIGLEDIDHLTDEDKRAIMQNHADEPVPQSYSIRDQMWVPGL